MISMNIEFGSLKRRCKQLCAYSGVCLFSVANFMLALPALVKVTLQGYRGAYHFLKENDVQNMLVAVPCFGILILRCEYNDSPWFDSVKQTK